ncbi:MAG: DUF1934 domain-containing protein [Eubacteriales bacterium]|nr:DUF1934 domain-containing protein [Eubacteriales bacterium]
MRNKQVLLTLTGRTALLDDDDGILRVTTLGKLSGKKDDWRLRYTETVSDESQMQNVTLTMGKGIVTMASDGPFGTDMVFEKGCRYEGSYRTPYGELDMSIFPTLVNYNISEDGNGEVNLKYQLDIGGRYAAVHKLHIKLQADNLRAD